jgi:hypothetical protein
MKTKYLLAISLVTLLISCNNNSKDAKNTLNNLSIEAIKYPTPTLLMTEIKDTSMESPQTIVSLAYGNKVEIVDTTSGNFVFMNDAEKAQSHVPKTATLAGKSFWAGLETMIIIDSTATGYVVKRKYEDESTDGKEPFEVLKSIPK